MTTRNEAREAIYQHFVDNWADRTPYFFGNEEVQDSDLAGVVRWARLTVRHTESEQETLGNKPNRRFKRQGRLFVQVFTSAEEGEKQLDVLVEAVEEIFEAITLRDCTIYFLAATSREDGQDGKWYRMTVSVPFWYEQRK